MQKSELTDFELEEENFKLKISRDRGVQVSSVPAYPPANMAMPAMQAAPAPVAPAAPAAPAEDENAIYVTSPMVGTFYRAPSPEASAFAEVGTTVNKDSVVCIIEAMKVMNEIQADVSGKVVEFLVENGEAVEYGQKLIKLK